MRQMGDSIVEAAGLVEEAMPLFRSISAQAARLGGIAERITQIEGRADDIHDSGLRELYRAHATSDAMAFIVGNEIYSHLEEVVDRFDDVANELNGFHDAANSVATIVSTRVLRPQYAVGWAAFFNFIAFLVFGLHVAQTLGTGIVEAEIVDARVVFGALTGAIVWNLVTWFFGIPSSSSHALIGGLLGA